MRCKSRHACQRNTSSRNTRYSSNMGWTILLYRLPSSDSRARVAVWRELRRSGALHLQQSVVAVPDGDAFASIVDELRAVVADVGGEATALRTIPVGDDDQQH